LPSTLVLSIIRNYKSRGSTAVLHSVLLNQKITNPFLDLLYIDIRKSTRSAS
jgi:hypothetical protein